MSLFAVEFGGEIADMTHLYVARIEAGGSKVPYYPWLDFGGRVGRRKSVHRPFLKDGRYIYDAFNRHRDDFIDVMREGLLDVARSA